MDTNKREIYIIVMIDSRTKKSRILSIFTQFERALKTMQKLQEDKERGLYDRIYYELLIKPLNDEED